MTPPAQIIRTSDGRLFRATPYSDAALDHVWDAVEVNRGACAYVEKAHAPPRMIRRACCVVVAECAA